MENYIVTSGKLFLSIDWPVENVIQLDMNHVLYDLSIKIGNKIIKEFSLTSPPAYLLLSLYDYSSLATNVSTYNFIINVCVVTLSTCARELVFIWDSSTVSTGTVGGVSSTNSRTTTTLHSSVALQCK